MNNRTRLLSRGSRRSVWVLLIVVTSLLISPSIPFAGRRDPAILNAKQLSTRSGPMATVTPLPTPTALPTPAPSIQPDGDSAIVTAVSRPGRPPGANLPNLDVMRTVQSTVPVISAPFDVPVGMRCEEECGPPPGDGDPPPTPPNDPNFSTPRTRPPNQTGEPGITMASRNFNWSTNLVSLSGRAGMDLDIALTYNSLVWTVEDGIIKFNADQGSPGPGFRLGFPIVQKRYLNGDTGIWSYLMVAPSGGRVDLRQVGTSNVYEAGDGSYTQLTDNGNGNLVVITRDGKQYTFELVNLLYVCTQIRDRNGNYISISHFDANPTTITDTLGRHIVFNYENGFLRTITQDWNGQQHTWARIDYGSIPLNYNFPGLQVNAPDNGTVLALPTNLYLDDGSHYEFTYNSWGQIYKISRMAPNGDELAHTRYNLPQDSTTAQYDCPRFTEQYEWARDWNLENGVAQEALTQLGVDSDGGQVMILPDGTRHKELMYSWGWQMGLPMQSEVWSGGVRQKLTTFAWTQDNVNAAYPKNPRLIETNTWDAAGTRKRQTINYGAYAPWSLPYELLEYAADGTTPVRSTYTDYNLDSSYLDRRIIGLVSAVHIFDHVLGVWASKITFDYDWAGEYLVPTSQAATQHDANNGDPTGRGNLVRVMRWDVTDVVNVSKALAKTTGYNSAGSAVFVRDERNHQVSTSYNDSSGGTTYAYPTVVTDADGFSTFSQYDYARGLLTQVQTPAPGGFAQGPVQSWSYDDARRVVGVSNNVNGAYTRVVYDSGGMAVQTFSAITGAGEAYAVQVFDGGGRVRAAAQENPASVGQYSGQYTVFDVMGRAIQQSNPTEMSSQWIAMGDDALAGWVYKSQSYDWNSRPSVTTNADQTQRTTSYGGCGCAGGEVTTSRDERGRQRRATNDVLGRLVKIEDLNWDGSIYATANYAYDALDHLKSVSFEGQTRSFQYDGYGRLQTRTTPEQGTTSYSYFPDNTVETITDARGAKTAFNYNPRLLVTSVVYDLSNVNPGQQVQPTANVAFAYDGARNRTSMTDALGAITYHYDQLSRLDWEERTFTNLGTFRLSYGYNLSGQLTSVTTPGNDWNETTGYEYDKIGRPTTVSGYHNYGALSMNSYVSNISYRAFGPKAVAYGNGRTLSLNYDNRLRLTRWDMPGLMGWNYSYSDFNENNSRVTYAQNLYDATLDRSYYYDQVGRLTDAHTGAEARAALQGQGATPDGPYSHAYRYDQFGNMWYRVGWGGSHGSWFEENPSFTNNRRNGFGYDAAGNLTNDGYQSFAYDATGQQTYASGTNLTQTYDGDGLRSKKTENNSTTYYLRSSVLGGRVVCELNGGGALSRGYAYLAGQLIAIQANNTVSWVHQDPVTKSQRVTDGGGNVTAVVDLDPWGGDTARSSNQGSQSQRYTTYTRDANGGDEAMFRRYQLNSTRFAQPDPYNGSFNLDDPQSFNRYSYTQNDPVNFVDRTGLFLEVISDFDCQMAWFLWSTGGCCGESDGTIEGFSHFLPGCVRERFEPIGGGGPGGGPGPGPEPQRPQTANECRAAALNKLAEELKARQELYASDSSKALSLVLGARSGAAAGGSLLGPGGAVLGGMVGIAVAGMGNDAYDANIEAGPVSRFQQAAKECEKKKRQEIAEAKKNGPFVQPTVPQQFVVTRQFGTFAMFSYTIWRPTLPGGQHYEQHGPNPTDPITRW